MVQNLLDPVNTALPVLTMGTNLNANADIPVTQPHHACFSNSSSTSAPICTTVHLSFEIVNLQQAQRHDVTNNREGQPESEILCNDTCSF